MVQCVGSDESLFICLEWKKKNKQETAETAERKLTERIILLLVQRKNSTSKTCVLKTVLSFTGAATNSNRCLRWRQCTGCRWNIHCICLCPKYHSASLILFPQQTTVPPSEILVIIMMCRFFFVWKKSRNLSIQSGIYSIFTQLTGHVRQGGEERLEATSEPFHALMQVGQCFEVTDVTQDLILRD